MNQVHEMFPKPPRRGNRDVRISRDPLEGSNLIPAEADHQERLQDDGAERCDGGNPDTVHSSYYPSPSTAAVPRLSSCCPTMTRWISDAPSQIRSTRSSRNIRSATFSRM